MTKPKPSILCESVEQYLAMMPKESLILPPDAWSKDLSSSVAWAVGSVGSVKVKGSSSSINIFHQFQEDLYLKLKRTQILQQYLILCT